jgi:predicted glutamine amidotransferase
VAHNCRLWALIGHDYPDTLLRDQLETGDAGTHMSLRELGHSNRDGWGFAYAPGAGLALPISGLLYRRGGPPADNVYDPDYGLAVDELEAIRPTAIVGHVRAATSGHRYLPDPHPFLHPLPSEGAMAFAHNGVVSVAKLLTMLGDYIDTHPLEYTVGMAGTGPIDSELFFLYLLKYRDEHPELTSFSESIPPAVREVIHETGSRSLNVTMTDGDTLYAIASSPLRYYPHTVSDGDETNPYWVVASQPMGSQPQDWATIPAMTLGVFAADAEPRFISLGVTAPERSHPAPRATRAPAAEADAAEGEDHQGEDHNCRFWALVGRDYPSSLIEDHLRDGSIQNLRALGAENDDGWGLGYFLNDWQDYPFTNPIVRRGGPPANHPHAPFFERAVNEARLIRPQAAIGHVRKGNSEPPGHLGIPDPHPFVRQHPRQSRPLLFAHNGSLDALKLGQRLGRSYLETHPPDYGSAVDERDLNHIDSELYFLYLLKLIETHPELPFEEALLAAVRVVAMDDEVTQLDPRLNFVLTDGDTLYAMNYYGETNSNLICFFPKVDVRAASYPSFWVAASESLGSPSEPGWGVMPPRTLGVFVPGQAPRMLPLDDSPEPVFTLEDLVVIVAVDYDCDGFTPQFHLCCDPNVNAGTWQVALALGAAAAGTTDWISLGVSRAMPITGGEPDTLCVSGFVWPDTLRAAAWDLQVALLEYSSGDTVALATPSTHAVLDSLRVEGAARDMIPDPPPHFTLATADVQDPDDRDGDGYARAFMLAWDANVNAVGCPGMAYVDSARVRLEIIAHAGADSFTVASIPDYWIRDAEEDVRRVEIAVDPDGAPATWDLHLRLFDAAADTLAASAGPDAYAALGQVRIEGAMNDTLLAPPDTLAAFAGPPRPTPGLGEVTLPIHVPQGGAEVTLEIWNVQGQRVWKQGPMHMEAGDHELRWDGQAGSGTRVGAGLYFGRVSIGGRSWLRRMHVLW